MKNMLLAVTGVAAMLVSAPAMAAANLVTNGDFETGTLAGWTANQTSGSPWHVRDLPPTDGSYAASTGCTGATCITGTTDQQAYLYQDIATIPGGLYNLSFDFSPFNGAPNELKVLFGTIVVADLVNTSSTGSLVNYTYSDLLAAGTSTQLEFLGRQDPGLNRLDNVILTAGEVGAVPEPSSWVMMIAGFGLVGAGLRYKKRQTVLRYA